MRNSNYKKRWEILDSMFRCEEPQSTRDILERLSHEGIIEESPAENQYYSQKAQTLLRQDIFKFKELYQKSANSNGELFVTDEEGNPLHMHEPGHKRNKLYQYRDRSFSIMPLIHEHLSSSDRRGLDKAFKLIKSAISPELYKQVEFAAESRIEYLYNESQTVDYSANTKFRGYSLLPDLYRHILDKNVIQITFTLFGEESETFDFHPIQLKFYTDNWYCIGYREDRNEWWPIGVDRIDPTSIRIINEKKSQYKDYIAQNGRIDFFDNIIGITFRNSEDKSYRTNKEIYNIVFKIHDYKAWERFISTPIHKSLEIIDEFNEATGIGRAQIKVRTNIELYMTVLSLGEDIEIESPESVRNEMKNILGNMYGLYCK